MTLINWVINFIDGTPYYNTRRNVLRIYCQQCQATDSLILIYGSLKMFY